MRRAGAAHRDPDQMAAAVKRAVDQGRSLVVGVPVHYEDYRRLF